MKAQLVFLNSLGEFKSDSKEMTNDEFDALDSFIRKNLDYFSFIDEMGQELVFKKDLIANSLIKIVKL